MLGKTGHSSCEGLHIFEVVRKFFLTTFLFFIMIEIFKRDMRLVVRRIVPVLMFYESGHIAAEFITF
jgi:hypothetical protein